MTIKVQVISSTQGVGDFSKFTSEQILGWVARVSNPSKGPDEPFKKLLRYLIRHKHWSPLEMIDVTVEIHCPRDISRQILRHNSFRFQEFSGRYAEYPDLEKSRELRLQDTSNRQNSLDCDDDGKKAKWDHLVSQVASVCLFAYRSALGMGVAREVARALLPEGLVQTRMFMKGSLRSWIHYWDVRAHKDTQREHQQVAVATRDAILKLFPEIAKALNEQETRQ